MTTKEIFALLRPKGNYTLTDMSNYTALSAGRIKSALITKDLKLLLPLFLLIEDKDSSVGGEINKRVDTLMNKFYTHKLDAKYNESFEELMKVSLDSTLFGIGVAEIYLDESGDFAFRHIAKEFFYFDEQKILLKENGKTIEVKEPRFLIFRKKAVMTKLLWLVYAKHFVLSHFLKFTEFLGVPPLIANITDSSAENIEAATEMISGLKSAGVAVLGRDDMLKVLEGRGSQDDFMAFVRYADEEIAKVINGSALTSNAHTSGSLALGKVHEKQRGEITASDIKWAIRCVAKAFKTIGIEPEFTIFYEEDKDLYQRAQTLQILHTLGYGMSLEDMSREFDLPLIKIADTAPAPNSGTGSSVPPSNADTEVSAPNSFGSGASVPPILSDTKVSAPNSFGSGAKMPIDKFDRFFASERFRKLLSKNEIALKKEIEKIIAKSNSFEEAFEALLKAYPNVDMSELEDAFMTVMLNSELLGLSEEEEL